VTFTRLSPHLYLGDIFDATRLKAEHPKDLKYMMLDVRDLIHFSACEDEDTLDTKRILEVVDLATKYILETGNPVYIHCFAGMERSPFIAALILWGLGDWTLDEAYEYVKREHPQTIKYQSWADKIQEAMIPAMS
jgi:protein-tyrosine phosphatase